MLISSRYIVTLLAALSVTSISASASGDGRAEVSPDSGFSTGDEFRAVQIELHLARSDSPYLVIAPARGELEIKLKGALVWSCPLTADSGQAGEATAFYQRFPGREGFLCRAVTGRHVYAYSEQLPDSVLATIAEATGFAPQLIQRDIPARMFVTWGDGLLIEIRTEIEGHKKPLLGNVLFDVRRAVSEVGEPEHPVFTTTPESALTLARMARVGVLTLLDWSD